MRRTTALVAGGSVLGAGLVVAVGLVLGGSGGGADASAKLPTPFLPAAPEITAHKTPGADGRLITCPLGKRPAVSIADARFTPNLVDATTLRPGNYAVGITGQITNETSAPITVTGITVTIQGKPVRMRLTGATQVPARDSVPLVLEGNYRSTHTETANVQTQLAWQWQDQGLRVCGEEGLIEDD